MRLHPMGILSFSSLFPTICLLSTLTLVTSDECSYGAYPSDTMNMITKYPQWAPWLEGGTIVLDEVSWTSATAMISFQSAVVFISIPQVDDGEAPVIARLNNVVSSGRVTFSARLFSTNNTYCRTWHTPSASPQTLSWLVVEQGAYNVSGNVFFVSQGPIARENSVSTNLNNFVTFPYPTGCTSPYESCAYDAMTSIGAISQLQTLVYPRMLIPRGVAVRRSFAKFVLQPNDALDQSQYVMPDPETLAYMTFPLAVSVLCTEKLSLSSYKFVPQGAYVMTMEHYFTYATPPNVFGMVGTSTSLADSTGLRLLYSNTTHVASRTQEDRCYDDEDIHTTPETVYFLVIGRAENTDTCTVCRGYASPDEGEVETYPPVAYPSFSPVVAPTLQPTLTLRPTYEDGSPTPIPTNTPTIASTSTSSPTTSAVPTSTPAPSPYPTAQVTSPYISRAPTTTPVPTSTPSTSLPTVTPVPTSTFSPSTSPSVPRSPSPTIEGTSYISRAPTTTPVPTSTPSTSLPTVTPVPTSTYSPSASPSAPRTPSPTIEGTSYISRAPTTTPVPTSTPSTSLPTVTPVPTSTYSPSASPSEPLSPSPTSSSAPTVLLTGLPSSTSPPTIAYISAIPTITSQPTSTLSPTAQKSSSFPTTSGAPTSTTAPSIFPSATVTSQYASHAPTTTPAPTSTPSTSLPTVTPVPTSTYSPSAPPSKPHSPSPTAVQMRTMLPSFIPTAVPSFAPIPLPTSNPTNTPFATHYPTIDPSLSTYDALCRFVASTNLADISASGEVSGWNCPEGLTLSNEELCNLGWTGLQCNANYEVTSLRLSNIGITGVLSSSIGALESLTSLDLSGNGLMGPLPYSLTQLRSLTHLRLGGNKFGLRYSRRLSTLRNLDGVEKLPISDALSRISELTYLNIASNSFSGEISDDFCDGTPLLDTLILNPVGTSSASNNDITCVASCLLTNPNLAIIGENIVACATDAPTSAPTLVSNQLLQKVKQELANASLTIITVFVIFAAFMTGGVVYWIRTRNDRRREAAEGRGGGVGGAISNILIRGTGKKHLLLDDSESSMSSLSVSSSQQSQDSQLVAQTGALSWDRLFHTGTAASSMHSDTSQGVQLIEQRAAEATQMSVLPPSDDPSLHSSDSGSYLVLA